MNPCVAPLTSESRGATCACWLKRKTHLPGMPIFWDTFMFSSSHQHGHDTFDHRLTTFCITARKSAWHDQQHSRPPIGIRQVEPAPTGARCLRPTRRRPIKPRQLANEKTSRSPSGRTFQVQHPRHIFWMAEHRIAILSEIHTGVVHETLLTAIRQQTHFRSPEKPPHPTGYTPHRARLF